ncbi:MAG: hypothetical protein JWO62_2616 [Acidimicrobiaceae bacterium]|jgi:hypothetical protein|nr:hypothetical protein [Acidimicrobiaceae bacterium]
MSYRQIAAELGCSVSVAYDAVQRGMAMVPLEGAAEAKRQELAKLDRIERHLLGVMEREHITVSHGKVIDIDGIPVLDDGPGVQAAVSLLRVMERRAKLLGLDAPSRSEVKVITEDEVDAEIKRLEAELASDRSTA